MIIANNCPRCNGATLSEKLDDSLCVNCGWRRVKIPRDVLDEVRTYWGKGYVGNRCVGNTIGTGKPPLSGWERELLRRAGKAG